MKTSIPKGTRDFSPAEMVRRNYIFNTIRKVFELYGFMPIETPAMEHLSTLMGKYGEEGDRLIFKVLKRGDKVKEALEKIKTGDNQEYLLSDEALRYDLTVPFARYVVQYQNDITFPFKRYQIQPVWRADRPQKGRYREFYQCDADVIGSTSLINEVELIKLIDDVFAGLKVPVIIKLNNRKILSGIAEIIGEKDKIIDITVAIDKIDKIGVDGVNKELKEKGIADNAIAKLQPLINFKGSNYEKIALLKNLLSSSEIGKKGIEELEYLFSTIADCQLAIANCELDITLARGLNYYTGAIIEVKADNTKCKTTFTSSICGGGRYDDLTGIFGLPNVSGVGISFGADRIYDVLEELNLFPSTVSASSTVMFANFGPAEEKYCLPLLDQLRKVDIKSELYPEQAKMKKQFDYANKNQIAYVIVVGSDEMQSGQLAFKNMTSGEQQKLTIAQIIEKLK